MGDTDKSTIELLINAMAGQQQSASQERIQQTTAFTDALDKLGSRFEVKTDQQTKSLRNIAAVGASIIALGLVLQAFASGTLSRFEGFGFTVESNPTTAEATSTVEIPTVTPEITQDEAAAVVPEQDDAAPDDAEPEPSL
jgi:hypothetical protein